MRTGRARPRFTRIGGPGEQNYGVVLSGVLLATVRREKMDLPWGGYAWRWRIYVGSKLVGHERTRLLAGYSAISLAATRPS